MDMMKADMRDVEKLERKLERFKKSAIPYANRAGINSSAFHARREAIKEIRRDMTLRNKWTTGSIRVEKARTLDMRKMSSSMGSLEEYMRTQELGGTKKKTGKKGVAIPTSTAAGQGKSSARTRLPRGRNSLKNIRLSNTRGSAKGARQARLLAVRMAISSGNRVVYMSTQRGRGIFRIMGGTKKAPERAKVRMLYDLSRPTVTIKRNTWLDPAVKRTFRVMPSLFVDALQFQARRHGLR